MGSMGSVAGRSGYAHVYWRGSRSLPGQTGQRSTSGRGFAKEHDCATASPLQIIDGGIGKKDGGRLIGWDWLGLAEAPWQELVGVRRCVTPRSSSADVPTPSASRWRCKVAVRAFLSAEEHPMVNRQMPARVAHICQLP